MASKTVKSHTLPKQGRTMAVLGDGFLLVKTGPASKKKLAERPEEAATVLIEKAGQALKKPGIDRRVVFRQPASGVFAFSIHPTDPTRIVREAADGSSQVGRLVNGRFLPSKAAA